MSDHCIVERILHECLCIIERILYRGLFII